MGALSPLHLVIVLVVALLILGPGKLPEVGASLGQAMKSLRDGLEGREDVPAAGPTASAAVPVQASAAPVAPSAPHVDPATDSVAPARAASPAPDDPAAPPA